MDPLKHSGSSHGLAHTGRIASSARLSPSELEPNERQIADQIRPNAPSDSTHHTVAGATPGHPMQGVAGDVVGSQPSGPTAPKALAIVTTLGPPLHGRADIPSSLGTGGEMRQMLPSYTTIQPPPSALSPPGAAPDKNTEEPIERKRSKRFLVLHDANFLGDACPASPTGDAPTSPYFSTISSPVMSGVGVDSFASSDGGNPDSGNTITSASKRIRRIKMIVNTVFNRIERLFDQPLFLMIANSVSCMLCCVGVILWVDFSMTTTQPGIWVYNLLHTALSSVGGMIIFFTLNMLNLIEDCEMSCTITWRRGDVIPGVTLSEIGERTQRVLRIYNASRFLYMSSRWVMLLSIWLLSLNLEWTPEITPIGNHDCIPPTYIPNTYNPSVAVGHFIAGATTYAEVYMYGLPLSDGVFGGLSGWPLEAPLNSFIVRSEGPVYAVKTSCDDAVEIVPYDDSRTWSDRWSNLTATLSFLNDTTQTWSITTVYPQGSVIEFNGTVQQTCSATMRFGSGYASYQYVVDEWDMVTGGQMSFVRTGSLSVVQGQSAKYSFADVTAHMSDPNEVHRIISNWTALTIAAVMNADYMPSQGGLFSNLMQWSTMPDGYYHVDENARGVAAVLSAIMQYVTMQYDGSQSEPCEYFGSTGAGRISVHQHWFIFFMASTLLTLTMTLIMFIRWSVKYRRGDYSMRTVVSLRHPLIMARDMRSIMNQFTRQAKSSRGGVSSRRDFHKWCSRQHVLFGEIASSPTHELGFGLKSNIRPCDPDKVSANQSGLVL